MLKMPLFLLLLLSCVACSDANNKADNNKTGSDMSLLDVSSSDDVSTVGKDLGTTDDATRSDVDDNEDLGNADTSADMRMRPDFGDTPFGGDRPATIILPSDYDETKNYPLVTLLHGYTSSGQQLGNYFRVNQYVDSRQFILILPDGLIDGRGNRFWNATDACCSFTNPKPDDSAYLIGLVDEAIARYNIDEDRIYFSGHSNGGFMSFTMACEYGDRIAAIASVAGTTFADPDLCPDTGDVSILHIHGTADGTISFNGGRLLRPYPGAEETVTRWAARNNCPNEGVDSGTIDIVDSLAGNETAKKTWADCANNTDVEFWQINGGPHSPAVNSEFTEGVLDFLFSHSK